MSSVLPGQLEGAGPVMPIAALLKNCWNEKPHTRPRIQQCMQTLTLPAVRDPRTPPPTSSANASQMLAFEPFRFPRQRNPRPLNTYQWDYFPEFQYQGSMRVEHVWTVPEIKNGSVDFPTYSDHITYATLHPNLKLYTPQDTTRPATRPTSTFCWTEYPW